MNFYSLCSSIFKINRNSYHRDFSRVVTRQAYLNKYKFYRVSESKNYKRDEYYIEPFRLIDFKKGFKDESNIIAGKPFTDELKKLGNDVNRDDWIELDEDSKYLTRVGTKPSIDEFFWNFVLKYYKPEPPEKYL